MCIICNGLAKGRTVTIIDALNGTIKLMQYNIGGNVMITISVCMIVKNEEAILARCLDSLKGIVDEIIIVDTGSKDKTKEIAAEYTNQIFDFEWINDFSAARNYSFSKASMEYIYVADADEVIDEVNREKFMLLKEMLLTEVEVVQMLYTNQLEYGTTYNYDVEYRPKLYKRLRNFQWVDQIHETVEMHPSIFDSDIEIIHLPTSNHGERDFQFFLSLIEKGERLSKKLVNMYAKELFIIGKEEDYMAAHKFFLEVLLEEERTQEEKRDAQCVIVRSSRMKGDIHTFFKNALKGVVDKEPASEVCYELGEYFFLCEEYLEAIIWFYNAAYESESTLNIHYGSDFALRRLAECYGRIGNKEQEEMYGELAERSKKGKNV